MQPQVQINKCPVCHQYFMSDESPLCECWYEYYRVIYDLIPLRKDNI